MSTIYWHIPISSKLAYKQISHRSTEGLSLEGTFGGLLVQPLWLKQDHYSRIPRTMSTWLLSNSKDERSHMYTNEPCGTIHVQLNIYIYI